MIMEWNQTSDKFGTPIWLPDIAKLIEKRLCDPKKLKSDKHSAKAIGESILRQVSEAREGTGGLRLSQSGACIRQLAYQYHHAEENGMSIDAASKIAFTIGDATEAILVAALLEAFEDGSNGVLYNAGSDQETVTIDVPISNGYSAEITGHPDGSMLLLTQDNKQLNCILEVKSMSDYGFRKFRKEGLGPDDSYYSQVQSFMHAKGFCWAYLVAYNKSAGAKDAEVLDDGLYQPISPLHGQWIPYDQEHVDEIKTKFRTVIQSNGPEEIDRPHGPYKKGQIAFPCDYCKYYKTCFPFAEEQAVESKWLQRTTKIKVFTGE